MIVPGGTPSVMPLSVASSTGSPAAMTRVEAEPGSVEMTMVQGFVPGLGGCAQPTMGAPERSPSRRTGLPAIVTVVCRGVSMTCPPWMQRIVAPVVTIGGMPRESSGAAQVGESPRRLSHPNDADA
jgi:hypothetical protein